MSIWKVWLVAVLAQVAGVLELVIRSTAQRGDPQLHLLTITATAYTLKALALAGAFYFFNDFPIRLKRHPIPGTIALQKVALMSYSAGANKQ